MKDENFNLGFINNVKIIMLTEFRSYCDAFITRVLLPSVKTSTVIACMNGTFPWKQFVKLTANSSYGEPITKRTPV